MLDDAASSTPRGYPFNEIRVVVPTTKSSRGNLTFHNMIYSGHELQNKLYYEPCEAHPADAVTVGALDWSDAGPLAFS